MKSVSPLSSFSSTWHFSQAPGCRCLHIRLRFTKLTGGAKKWPKKAWLATNTQCHVIQRFLNCNVCMHSSVMQHSVQKMYQSVGKMSNGSGDVAIWYYQVPACSAVSLLCGRCWWELIITDNVDAWSQAWWWCWSHLDNISFSWLNIVVIICLGAGWKGATALSRL